MKAEEPKVTLSGRYSINETCELLGIHRDSLYKYTHNTCEIKCSEILRYWRANAHL